MNRLVGHGWNDQRIIDSYNSLSGLCLLAIISVYIYFFFEAAESLIAVLITVLTVATHSVEIIFLRLSLLKITLS